MRRALIRSARLEDLRRLTSFRLPSESWGIPVGGRHARPMNIPAFAGMTVGVKLLAKGPVQ